MADAFYPFVGEGAQDPSELPEMVENPARIAVFDDPTAAPRVVVVQPKDVRSYLEEVTATVTRLANEQGGRISFTVIREVVENFVHAYFSEPTVSILDGGNTIRFSDQGPGIKNKAQALQYGTTSATEGMKRYIRGVGSGLPYAQQYMRDHGGDLTIEDNIAGGAIVTITMAAQQAPAAQHAPSAPEQAMMPGGAGMQATWPQSQQQSPATGSPAAGTADAQGPSVSMEQQAWTQGTGALGVAPGMGEPFAAPPYATQQQTWPQQPYQQAAPWPAPQQGAWPVQPNPYAMPQQGAYPMQQAPYGTTGWGQAGAYGQPNPYLQASPYPQAQPWGQGMQAQPGAAVGIQQPQGTASWTGEVTVSQRGREVLSYLSLHESVGPTELTQLYGSSMSTWTRELQKLEMQGLIRQEGQKRFLTEAGRAVAQGL